MKKYITLLLLIVAIGTQAQTLTRIKSKSQLADSIYIIKGGIEIAPIIVTVQGDSARSFDYVLHVQRDTSINPTADIRFYDKSGQNLPTLNQSINTTAFTRWALLINKIDAYIINQRKRLVKQ